MRVRVHSAGTPQLVLQMREGAPVDVFVSADEASVNRAIQQDSIQGPPIAFARNGLALIIPPATQRTCKRCKTWPAPA
ncbi:MAG: substrate-binding domain-containing protein [Planctomycetota bacterium]